MTSFVSAQIFCNNSEIITKCGESSFSTNEEGSFNLFRYCSNDPTKNEVIKCSNGCIFGSCIDESVILCEDSDGYDIYNKGILKDNFHGGEVYEDFCIDESGNKGQEGSQIMEYYCTELREIKNSYSSGRRHINKMSVFSYNKTDCKCIDGRCIKEEIIWKKSFIERFFNWLRNIFN